MSGVMIDDLIFFAENTKHKELLISVSADEAGEIQDHLDRHHGVRAMPPSSKSPMSAIPEIRTAKLDNGVTLHLNVCG